MYLQFSDMLDERFNIDPRRTRAFVLFTLILVAAVTFALCCTMIVAFDDVFLEFNNIANLTIGSLPTEDIIAPEERSFVSEILTEQERNNVLSQVPPVFYPPDPNVARQQRELTENILTYIDNVRGDSYASLERQIADIKMITSLQLNENEDAIVAILQLPDDSWLQVRSEIISVLERVMREEIRAADLKKAREQLPTQVSLRLSPQESQIVTLITADVIRANTFENPEQTAIDRAEALNKCRSSTAAIHCRTNGSAGQSTNRQPVVGSAARTWPVGANQQPRLPNLTSPTGKHLGRGASRLVRQPL